MTKGDVFSQQYKLNPPLQSFCTLIQLVAANRFQQGQGEDSQKKQHIGELAVKPKSIDKDQMVPMSPRHRVDSAFLDKPSSAAAASAKAKMKAAFNTLKAANRLQLLGGRQQFPGEQLENSGDGIVLDDQQSFRNCVSIMHANSRQSFTPHRELRSAPPRTELNQLYQGQNKGRLSIHVN